MKIPDLINSLFEFTSGVFLWNSFRILMKHKAVRGYSILTVAFFSLWGYWNLFYYPHLEQWLSFFGGINVVLPNSLWVIFAIYYTRRNKK